MLIPEPDTPPQGFGLAHYLPTLSILAGSILLFIILVLLSLRTRRYAHLRVACLPASFLPFLATLAWTVIKLTGYLSVPGGSGIGGSREELVLQLALSASELLSVSVLVSALCFILALVILFVAPTPIAPSDPR